MPTVAEVLEKPFALETWFAIAAPARLPEAAQARLTQAAQALAGDEALRGRLLALGLAPLQPGTPQTSRAAVHAEIARWAAVIARTGMERQ